MRILIIGGGPAGLAAAIAAARSGASVVVADRMDRLGKKLLATGNGRCNLSNASLDAQKYHGAGAKTAYEIIGRAGGAFIGDFFNSVGVLTALEDGTRIYPRTFSAGTALNALRAEIARLGAAELTGREAISVKVRGGVFETAFRGGTSHTSDRVIVAAGGKAAPSLGSNGSGYGLFTKFGHSLSAMAPALTQLRLEGRDIRGLKGLRVKAALSLLRDAGGERQIIFREAGELLFTGYGLSGIPALNASCRIAPLVAGPDGPAESDKQRYSLNSPDYFVSIDLFPEYSINDLYEFLSGQVQRNPQAPIGELLRGVLHKQIALLVAERIALSANSPDARNYKLSERVISRAGRVLKDWRLNLTGVMGFDGAQVTYGGLPIDEFSPDSLESKIVKGLYAAGEILDVAGECGGYNLHWAWVSGYLAGIRAAGSA